MYKTSSTLQQLWSLMLLYMITFVIKILWNFWQNLFRSFVWTIQLNVKSFSFIELIKICILFEVKMIWCCWRILSSSSSKWKLNIQINALILIFTLIVQKMILKLKSDKIFKYLTWRQINCLFFMKIFNV